MLIVEEVAQHVRMLMFWQTPSLAWKNKSDLIGDGIKTRWITTPYLLGTGGWQQLQTSTCDCCTLNCVLPAQCLISMKQMLEVNYIANKIGVNGIPILLATYDGVMLQDFF